MRSVRLIWVIFLEQILNIKIGGKKKNVIIKLFIWACERKKRALEIILIVLVKYNKKI